MSVRVRSAVIVLLFVGAVVGGAGWSSLAAAGANPPQSQAEEHTPACGPARPGYARCHAVLVKGGNGGTVTPDKRSTTTRSSTTTTSSTTTSSTTTTTSSTTTTTASTTTTTAPTTTTTTPGSCTTAHRGYTPCDLQSAYNLPSATAGVGQTVAIVDAYDDPTAENDLNVYRAAYGLSPCTTANGCFKKVNQNGVQGSYPAVDTGWAQEISLDLDMVSAVCSNCHILLVEASSSSLANLGTAVDTAAAMGAQAISNSYGAAESNFFPFSPDQSHYNHPGHAITVSSGDGGYGVEFPASSNYVTAVGGTSLSRATNARGWTETAWSGAGSGCSRFFAKNAWQTDSGCTNRTVADVSAVADPSTGVAVYDSTADSSGNVGWLQFGGTSVAAPIVASVYALAGNGTSVSYGSYPYSHTGSLYDVTSGSNGVCTTSYLCTAGPGYDGPTGLGTPNGTAGF